MRGTENICFLLDFIRNFNFFSANHFLILIYEMFWLLFTCYSGGSGRKKSGLWTKCHFLSITHSTEANQAIHRVRPNILSLMFLHVVMDVTDVYPKGFGPILVFLPSRAIQRLGLPPKTAKKGQMANFGCRFLGMLFTLHHPNTASKAVILPQN